MRKLGLGLGLSRGRRGPSGPTYSVSISGLTSNPTYGSTAQIGVELTASASGWSGDAPASVAWQWYDGSGAISGATSAAYTPVSGDDLEAIYATATPSDTYDPKNSAAYTVRYAPPVAAGGISDQSYPQDSAISTLDVSADFTGSGITYALAPSSAALPAGLSLSGAGAITGTPTAEAAEVIIVVRGTNSGGYDDTAFGITISAASAWTPGDGLTLVSVTDQGGGVTRVTLTDGVDTAYSDFSSAEYAAIEAGTAVGVVRAHQTLDTSNVFTIDDDAWTFWATGASPEFLYTWYLDSVSATTGDTYDATAETNIDYLLVEAVLSCTLTLYGDPVAAGVVTVEAQAAASEYPVWTDDFSGYTNGQTLTSENADYTAFENGSAICDSGTQVKGGSTYGNFYTGASLTDGQYVEGIGNPQSGTSIRLACRMTDAGNGYTCRFNAGIGGINLYRKVSGTETQIASGASGTWTVTGSDQTFRVQIVGSDIEVYVDGVLKLSYTDPTPISSGPYAGFLLQASWTLLTYFEAGNIA